MSDRWADWCRGVDGLNPRVAVILGSGLGEVVSRLTDAVSIPYTEVPNWPVSTVAGHAGRLIAGRLAGVPAMVMQGRFHFYEGRSVEEVTAPVRLAAELGVSAIIATNAAGGIRSDLDPGSLMAIHEHRYWRDPSTHEQRERRFDGYSELFLGLMTGHGWDLGLVDDPGVYGNVTGPSYETAAEIRAMRLCGIDAVGMSTAQEIDAAAELGLECAAISCITNRGTGLADTRHDHESVVKTADSAASRLAELLERTVAEAFA